MGAEFIAESPHAAATLNPAGSPRTAPSTLLDRVIAATGPAGNRVASVIDDFLGESTTGGQLNLWLDQADPKSLTPQVVSRELSRDIARIDAMLARQVNAVLHHGRFQQLEASWRGLWYLTGQAKQGIDAAEEDGEQARLKIRVLHLPKRELYEDLDRAVEFDRSQIFRKVYESEFGMPGGEPYGVIVGDYEFTNHPEDLDLLDRMSQVSAASFAPFIAAASPKFLGLDDFAKLELPDELSSTFNQLPYLKWRSLRDSDDSRFVGLVLPRVIMRAPYVLDGSRRDGFRFREDVEDKHPDNYLWGTAGYAFVSVLIRAFCSSGWFAEIRGFERGTLGGGLVTDLYTHSFGTDARSVATKFSTDVAINDHQEQELSSQGLIPLCPCKDTEFSVFFSNASANKPKKYDDSTATTNARISSMLQYVFCVSRFAHYLKVLERDKIGGSSEAEEVQTMLSRWIHQYVAVDEKASPQTKARYPLREANIEVRPMPGKPGSYRLVIHLLPHSQLDQLSATLKLVTTVRSVRSN